MLLTGCGDGNSNDNYNGSENNNSIGKVAISNLETTGITSNYYKSNDTSCPAFGYDIIYADDKYFVSNENGIFKMYEYNLNLKYSNGTNCKFIYEYPEEVKYIAYKDNYKCDPYHGAVSLFTVYSDYSYHPFKSNVNGYNSYACYNTWKYNYTIKNPFSPTYLIQYKDYSDGKVVKSQGYSTISSLVIEKDKIYSIHEYTINDRAFYSSDVRASNNNMVYLDFEDTDEKIERVLNGIVITNKNVYVPGIVDYGCYEYADGTCKNGYKKNEELSKLMNDIVFINESYVVFNDGTTYSMWDSNEFGEKVW